MVWIQNQLVGAFVGDSLSIECHVEAFPKPINYWSSENGNLVTQGKYITMNYILYAVCARQYARKSMCITTGE